MDYIHHLINVNMFQYNFAMINTNENKASYVLLSSDYYKCGAQGICNTSALLPKLKLKY